MRIWVREYVARRRSLDGRICRFEPQQLLINLTLQSTQETLIAGRTEHKTFTVKAHYRNSRLRWLTHANIRRYYVAVGTNTSAHNKQNHIQGDTITTATCIVLLSILDTNANIPKLSTNIYKQILQKTFLWKKQWICILSEFKIIN